MHSYIASKIYTEISHLPLEEIKEKHKDKRQNAKAAGFAIQFGGVGATIARNLSIPIEEGNAVYNGYMEAFPNVKSYFKICKENVLKNGYIVINKITGARVRFSAFREYLGLKREINQEFWEKYKAAKELNDYENNPIFIKLKEKLISKSKLEGRFERASYNFPVQGTAAAMTKIAAIYVFNEIKAKGKLFNVLFPLIVHDQIVLECDKEESELWAKIVSDSMVKSGNIFCKSVQIKAVPEILEKWKK